MPQISVIVPVYNVGLYLSQCLDSILGQSLEDFEVLCINDGSTDNCGAILTDYAAKDSRVKVFTQENRGLSSARNVGLQHAEGEYIAFVDSDDFVHPEFLKTMLNAVLKTGSDVACCGFCKIYGDDVLPPEVSADCKVYDDALSVLLQRKNIVQFTVWNKLYKHELIKDFRFAEGISFEDWVFNCCVFVNVKKLVWVNSKMYGYRISANSIMRGPFTLDKLHYYDQGIRLVYDYYRQHCPQLWLKVKRSRVARSSRMMMSKTIKSHDEKLYAEARKLIKRLYAEKLIGYRGLPIQYKFRLFKFIHG